MTLPLPCRLVLFAAVAAVGLPVALVIELADARHREEE